MLFKLFSYCSATSRAKSGLRELDVSGNVLAKRAIQVFKAPWLIQKIKVLKTKSLSLATRTHMLNISKQCEITEQSNNTCILKSLKESYDFVY